MSVFRQDEGHGVLDHAVSLWVERDEQGLQQLPRAVRQLEPDEAAESTHQIGAGDLVGLANTIIIQKKSLSEQSSSKLYANPSIFYSCTHVSTMC